MTTSMMRGVRRGVMLLATGAIVGGGGSAAAQDSSRLPPGAIVQPLEDAHGAELRRHLNTLADNPRSVDALIGAGRAALDSGDAEAALSFFGRADELSPRNARVRAGMAAAMVRMGQAQAALMLFGEAVQLGAPEAEIAADRGLARDMVGDPRRAQQDYALALRHRDDDEVKRRLALSLAITGERDAALRLIDQQLRRHDRAAWRVHAFVLALTGDAAGAARSAESVMPAGTAQAMAPFLARLASLSPAQKAMAVHFGQFPADGRADQAADVSADPGAVALAMGGPPPARPQARPSQPAASSATTPRRRPERVRDSSDPYGLRGVRRTPRREDRSPQQQPAEQPSEPAATRWAGAAPESRPPQPPPAQAQVAANAGSAVPEPQPARPEPQPADTSPGFSLPSSGAQSAETSREERPALADIEALVESLPEEPAPAPQRRAEPVRTAQAQPEARRPVRQRSTRPSHPARHWVQIAGGANRAALPRELSRLRALAPDELRGRTAWVARANATNRLLIGPFVSASEAQAFVNRLARRDISAFAWTSAAGEEIERLPPR